MLRFLTAGESHGPALVVIVEGMPAGLPILVDDIASELARRRLGYGRGPRMRFEQDELELLGGIRHGRTLGSPIAIVVRNSEWATGKWAEYPLMMAETDVRRIDLDPTNPKRVWYSGVLSSRIGYMEMLQ